jgi:hypothetical protein
VIERGLPAYQIDTSRPHPARMYNYYLGGKDNYEVDRVAADRVIAVLPEVLPTARENRTFMIRAARFLARQQIRHVIDIGTGIPTEPYLHDIVRTGAQDTEVVYVDNDPIVAVHVSALLNGDSGATFALTDLRDPEKILTHPRVAAFLTSGQPIALVMAAVLHFVSPEDDPAGVVAVLREALPVGSYLVISHCTADFAEPRHDVAGAVDVYRGATAMLSLRPHAEIAGYFGDFELVPPGLVQAPAWRPGPSGISSDSAHAGIYGGIGRRVR